MGFFTDNFIVQNIVFAYRYFFPERGAKPIPSYTGPSAETEPVKIEEKEPPKIDSSFAASLADAEYLVTKKLYREALGLYRKIDTGLSGSGELMKIQFVRDRIESLLKMIMAEPMEPEAAKVIIEEKKSRAERFKSTALEADNYIKHELYNEAMFLYQKLEKEWADSGSEDRINFISRRIQLINKRVGDRKRITADPEDRADSLYLDENGNLTGAPSETPGIKP
jgi:hypothetical protein